jgi:hypothetical protein
MFGLIVIGVGWGIMTAVNFFKNGHHNEVIDTVQVVGRKIVSEPYDKHPVTACTAGVAGTVVAGALSLTKQTVSAAFESIGETLAYFGDTANAGDAVEQYPKRYAEGRRMLARQGIMLNDGRDHEYMFQ